MPPICNPSFLNWYEKGSLDKDNGIIELEQTEKPVAVAVARCRSPYSMLRDITPVHVVDIVTRSGGFCRSNSPIEQRKYQIIKTFITEGDQQ